MMREKFEENLPGAGGGKNQNVTINLSLFPVTLAATILQMRTLK